MQILLVDDEPMVTEALDRLLFEVGDSSWEVVTAGSGAEALDWLERRPFTVLVADMRMPKMSGEELLAIVAQRWPETVRVVLSGQASEVGAQQAARYAHQFLAKPCTHQALVEVLARSDRFGRVIRDERLRAALGGTTALPPAPATYAKLSALLADSSVSIHRVAEVIKVDPALTAKVLQLVNSAFFATAARITDIQRATARIGLKAVQAVVLSAEVERMMSGSRTFGDPWADGERAAEIASALAAGRPFRADACTAALLAPVGLLAVAATRPEVAAELARATGPSAAEVDQAVLGVSRHFVSAALLSIWGLPDGVVDPLRHADCPASAPAAIRPVADVVHVAIARVTGRPVDPSVTL